MIYFLKVMPFSTKTSIVCEISDSRAAYSLKYASCFDAFANGRVHPEPGKPVQLVLADNSVVNCSMEDVYRYGSFCPTGWYGVASSEYCFQINLKLVDNEEACRYHFGVSYIQFG